MEGRTIVRPDMLGRLRSMRQTASFNGGPDNCPARLPAFRNRSLYKPPFNGGPDNCPARRRRKVTNGLVELQACLQWRAGQLSGQTSLLPPTALTVSMEGRTIVRGASSAVHLQWRAGQLSGQTRTTISGRQLRVDLPSMEGRTIVRPDQMAPAMRPSFNGGPDNCPATRPRDVIALQWRAGQLSGQTRQTTTAMLISSIPFNGGPDNCPARHAR